MPDILLFDWRLDKAIEHDPTVAFSPRHITIPDLPLRVMLDAVPASFTMVQKDPLLHQILVDECKKAFTAALRKIVMKLQFLDDECGRTGDFYKYAESRKNVMQQIDLDIDDARREALRYIEHRWLTIQQQKKEYKQYRLSVGVKVVKGAKDLAIAGLGVAAAAPTGGATLALAIVSAYRGLMEAGKTLYDCILEADRFQKKVESGLKSLRNTYASGKPQGVARELAASAANALLKIPVTNLATLDNDAKTWKGKLTHLRFLAHELATELNEMLDKASKLSAQLGSAPNAKKIQDSLKKVEANVNKLLEQGFIVPSMGRRVLIQKSHQDADRGLAAHAKVAEAIEELKKGRSAAVDWFDKVIALVADVSLRAAGYGVEGALPTATDAVQEIGSVLAPVHEMVVDAVPQVKQAEEKVKGKLYYWLHGKPAPPPSLA